MFMFKISLKRYGNSKDSIIAYTSKNESKLDGVSGIFVESEDNFFDNHIFRNEDFISLYNSLSTKDRVQRFSDRRTAAKRTWAVFLDLASRKLIQVKDTSSSNNGALPKTSGVRGRKSKHEGKRIILKGTYEKNPRRRFSHGYNSFAILMKNPEILYEQYIAKGGRRQDLSWDLYMKRVKVIK